MTTTPTKLNTAMIVGLNNITVTSRTDMAAVPVIAVGQTVFLFEGGRSGTFVLKAGAIPFTDTLQAVYVASSTAGYYWERHGYGALNFLWFGADPVYSALKDNYSPFQNAIALCGATGKPLYIPAGRYGFITPVQVLVDAFKPLGIVITGDGRARSILDFRSVLTAPNMIVRSSTIPKDSHYFQIERIGIYGSIAGDVLRLGDDDFGDPINVPVFEDVSIQNFDTSSSSVAVRMNYVLGGRFNWQVNCGSGGFTGGFGTAVVCRQCSFNDFFGSMGSAEISMLFKDGFNIGNVIHAPDFENIKIAVRFLSGTNNANTFIGGQWSFSTAGIDCQVGTKTYVLNPNIAANAPATAANFVAASVGLTVTP